MSLAEWPYFTDYTPNYDSIPARLSLTIHSIGHNFPSKFPRKCIHHSIFAGIFLAPVYLSTSKVSQIPNDECCLLVTLSFASALFASTRRSACPKSGLDRRFSPLWQLTIMRLSIAQSR